MSLYGAGVAAYGFIFNSEAIVKALFEHSPALSLSKEEEIFS